MRTLLPYLAILDAAFFAAGCGSTTTPDDGGTDGTTNDVIGVFETGGSCFEAGSPIAYTLCAASDAAADAMSDAASDACATSCDVPCKQVYGVIDSCTDDGSDAGVAYATCVHTLCSAGRRPTGLRKPRSARGASHLAKWLGSAAWMERASVCAFDRLARELRAHGAPAWLVREAKRAARDEVRHARAMGRLARAHGARVPRVRFRVSKPRPLATIAKENAVEGCVHEAYGALVARVQSDRASDVGIRRVMTGIAADEKRHAALALALADWIEPRLTPAQRARIARARSSAREDLLAALAIAPSIPSAGIPGGREARALCDALLRDIHP